MRILLFSLGVFATIFWTEKPAEAQSYPWGADYGPAFGATNCGFATFQQCLATVSGIGGSCEPNTMYRPAPESHPSTRRRPRQHPH